MELRIGPDGRCRVFVGLLIVAGIIAYFLWRRRYSFSPRLCLCPPSLSLSLSLAPVQKLV
jgi:hypothetical protein